MLLYSTVHMCYLLWFNCPYLPSDWLEWLLWWCVYVGRLPPQSPGGRNCLCVFLSFIWFVYVAMFPPGHTQYIFHMPVARYSLSVLKVLLITNKPTNEIYCALWSLPSVLWHCWSCYRKVIQPVKNLGVGLLVVIWFKFQLSSPAPPPPSAHAAAKSRMILTFLKLAVKMSVVVVCFVAISICFAIYISVSVCVCICMVNQSTTGRWLGSLPTLWSHRTWIHNIDCVKQKLCRHSLVSRSCLQQAVHRSTLFSVFI